VNPDPGSLAAADAREMTQLELARAELDPDLQRFVPSNPYARGLDELLAIQQVRRLNEMCRLLRGKQSTKAKKAQ
jgi:hypothetical protein